MALRPPIAWRRRALAGALAAALGLGACGGGGGGSEKPAYCADRAALQQSLRRLGDVDVRTQGLDALEARLRQVQQDANALARSARDDFGPEVLALKSAIARLQRAAQEAVAAPSAQSASDVAAEVSRVTSAFGALSDAVRSRC